MPPPPQTPPNDDTITLHALHTTPTLSTPDAWGRPLRPTPLLLTLTLTTPAHPAATTDTLAATISYGAIAKAVLAATDRVAFASLDHLTAVLGELAGSWPGERLRIEAVAPGGVLRVEGDGGGGRVVLLERGPGGEGEWVVSSEEWFVRGIRAACVIGVNKHERGEKQGVVVGVRVVVVGGGEDGDGEGYGARIREEGGELWRGLVRRVCEVTEPSTFQTLEALAAHIARTCLEDFPLPQITVAVAKPSAVTFAAAAEVEITRQRAWLLSS